MSDKNQPKKGYFQKRKENISRNVGMPILKGAARFMGDIARGFFTIPKTEQRESFEQAMRRMHLSEADLSARHKQFMQQFFIFLLGSLGLLLYSIYLFAELALIPATIVLLMAMIFVIYAFRAHFWAFQIKHKKLGCSWQEWWENKTTEEKEKQELTKK